MPFAQLTIVSSKNSCFHCLSGRKNPCQKTGSLSISQKINKAKFRSSRGSTIGHFISLLFTAKIPCATILLTFAYDKVVLLVSASVFKKPKKRKKNSEVSKQPTHERLAVSP